ncbi:alpha-L-arabinofuranosidase C-terminal domain-containing protein [Telmatobacter sp. DSM 110680]|uniref:non-reducing end alpha-L-arabinofuranosidase n=1 Tax=Telmatobacter sp. DSM 110680 TaxID=3036704 RepID=A0AAU7DLL8_9BACT
MPEKTFARLLAIVAIAVSTVVASGQNAPATLTIHPDQPTSTVSPTLYGLMTEEINYSYDGGLYAEMVRNRTFRGDWSGILYWYLVEDGNARAKIEVDESTGPSSALPKSLKVNIEQADAKNQAGVLNVGWWGMALHRNTIYKGSFYAKAGSTDIGPITVSLVNDNTGKAVASATVDGIGTDWKQHTFALKTGEIEASASNHLVISAGRAGTLWLQLVSLFPPTYHDRTNGFRKDLMEKMAAMHPAFLRMPGGNYLEGDHIKERFEWKKTIGPLVDRPTHRSPWNYQSSDGMGLLEFLGWCEDLHMQPLLAVYAGYSLSQEHVNPGADLEPYVQDALDEIEYVSGGPDTKWGAERAKDGHPAPFKLSYVEIGNEDWFDRSGSYDERYTQFYKAIKAKYPDLQLIATAPVKSVKPDVIDEHYYVRATQNFHDAAHYDTPDGNSSSMQKWDSGHFDRADRNGPKIFVGEWATREGSPTPNMGAALGDAAWMTGLERNSDLVVMAAYAPMLVNVNPGGMQWETDLIGYNAMKSYGSPAYYAQVMFASYLGDHTVASRLENGGEKLFYSATLNTAKKQIYLKLVNASSDAQPLELAMPGVHVAASARMVRLSAPDTQTTNSIEDPTRLVPVESTLHNVNSKLMVTLPPYSIQVLQIDLQ